MILTIKIKILVQVNQWIIVIICRSFPNITDTWRRHIQWLKHGNNQNKNISKSMYNNINYSSQKLKIGIRKYFFSNVVSNKKMNVVISYQFYSV